MKRALFVVTFVAVFCLSFTLHHGEDHAPSKAEMFGLELQACKQAYASGKPAKCKLFGKIKVVDNFEDVKIKKVDNFEDIKVKWVDNFADKPGRWKKVDNFEDYKVKFVDNFEDYKIKLVDNFEGCD
jgi:hypothetical protein